MPFFYTEEQLLSNLAVAIAGSGGGAGGIDKGIWNPKTNTPDIFTLLTNSGEFAVIDGLDAGETYNFDFGGTKGGVVAFTIGDKVYFNGVIFQKQESYIPTANEIIYDKTNPLLGSVKDVVDLKGSVANVSITSNNGITSSIINSSTTPTITLGLGNIAPTSVNSTGSITGSNLSGTNTGDETKSSIETKLGVSIVNVINTEGNLSTQVPTAEAILNQFNPAILNLEQQIDLKEDKANKGIANGYAELDATGKVPSTQLPSIASSIATLSDVALNLLNNNEVLIYNSVTTKWENKSIQNVAGGEVVPIGSIQAFYSNTIPVGYLLCDGSTFNATEYPDLYTFLGSNTLPDLRGYFLRGLGGVDPDIGRTLGSIQEDDLKSHNHIYLKTQDQLEAGILGYAQDNNDGNLVSTNTSSTGGLETRPKNIAVNYIIKAKHNPASAYNLVAGTDISITINEVNKTATISSTGYTNDQINTALNLKANQTDVDFLIAMTLTL